MTPTQLSLSEMIEEIEKRADHDGLVDPFTAQRLVAALKLAIEALSAPNPECAACSGHGHYQAYAYPAAVEYEVVACDCAVGKKALTDIATVLGEGK